MKYENVDQKKNLEYIFKRASFKTFTIYQVLLVKFDTRSKIQTQEKYTSTEQQKHLNRPRQPKINSRCFQSTHSILVSSCLNHVDEVIYSQGEPYPEEPYDRRWDSDEDFRLDEDYTLPSGWI